jgi:hypothetical protein
MFSNKKAELFRAIKTDDATAVREILIDKKLVHPDCVYETGYFESLDKNKQKWTPLLYAMHHHANKSFQMILTAKADPNKYLQFEDNRYCHEPPLIITAGDSSIERLEKLLAVRARVDIKHYNGETALIIAARKKCNRMSQKAVGCWCWSESDWLV